MQDDRDATSASNTAQSVEPVNFMRSRLLAFDESQLRLLSGIIGSYVQKMGLASADRASSVAQEVMQEAFVEALTHADHFRHRVQRISLVMLPMSSMLRSRWYSRE